MKKYLLDTHTILWFLNGDKNLSSKAKEIISSGDNQCYISVGSLWEITIKIKLGRLDLGVELKEFAELLSDNDIKVIQISVEHLLALLDLEDLHGDPFDKLILSQAKSENMGLISKD